MRNAIREDLADQVARFVAQLEATFDPHAYHKPDDGPQFDSRLRALESDFERIKRAFHDFLMAEWSDEIRGSLRETLDSNRGGKGSAGGQHESGT